MVRTKDVFEGEYSEEKDILNRVEELDILYKIISNAQGPYTIAIDAKWGTGKTAFTKMLQSKLGEEIKSAYINVWEADYNSDPMIALISELKQIVDSKTYQTLKDTFLKFSKIIVPATIDIAVGGVIKSEKIAEAISKATKGILEDRIDSYEKELESIKELKRELSKATEKANNNKIVIFIDELDRCRPTYALDFLERVKHFFDLKGFIFILSIDQTQLIESIKSVYGNNFDSEHYLKRFVDFFFYLEPKISKKYILKIIEASGFEETIKNGEANRLDDTFYNEIVVLLLYISSKSKMSIRDLNQIIGSINLICILRKYQMDVRFATFLSVFITLKHLNKEVYHNFILGESDLNEIYSILGLSIDNVHRGDMECVGNMIACILSKGGSNERIELDRIKDRKEDKLCQYIESLSYNWDQSFFNWARDLIGNR